MELLAVVVLAVVVFTATNIDDLFVLLAFFIDPMFRRRHIVAGQYVGMGALVGISILISQGMLLLPGEFAGFLGLVPLGIGMKKLWDLRGGETVVVDIDTKSRGAKTLTVAAVTIANGGDNIAVYVPVFATRSGPEIILFVAVFAAMVAVWIAAVYVLITRPSIGRAITRYGPYAVPWVLMALGTYILIDAQVWSVLW